MTRDNDAGWRAYPDMSIVSREMTEQGMLGKVMLMLMWSFSPLCKQRSWGRLGLC